MNRRAFLRNGAIMTSAILAGCVVRSEPEFDIGMSADAYLPPEFTIEVGDLVDWRNTGSRAHTVTAYEASLPAEASYFASGDFDSQSEAVTSWFDDMGGAMYTGEHYEHRFDVPGEYPYYCIPHEVGGMIGTIIVE